MIVWGHYDDGEIIITSCSHCSALCLIALCVLRRLLRVIESVNETHCASSSSSSSRPWRAFFPPPKLCTDNGVMVAWAGVELFCRGASSPCSSREQDQHQEEEEDQQEELEPVPRWALGLHVNRHNDVVFRKRVKQPQQ
jgi:hypothetical protein